MIRNQKEKEENTQRGIEVQKNESNFFFPSLNLCS